MGGKSCMWPKNLQHVNWNNSIPVANQVKDVMLGGALSFWKGLLKTTVKLI